MKDKNNIYIKEGDILLSPKKFMRNGAEDRLKRFVGWHNGYLRLKTVFDRSKKFNEWSWKDEPKLNEFKLDEHEIIGNIYHSEENEELLTNKTSHKL